MNIKSLHNFYDRIFCIIRSWDKVSLTLKDILDNSCYLILDLEKKVDYDLEDVDKVKSQNFPKCF